MTCAFLYFSRERRPQIKEANPDMKNTEVSAELGRLWNSLSEEEKQPYVERSNKDRERYMYEKSTYDSKQHTIEEAEHNIQITDSIINNSGISQMNSSMNYLNNPMSNQMNMLNNSGNNNSLAGYMF